MATIAEINALFDTPSAVQASDAEIDYLTKVHRIAGANRGRKNTPEANLRIGAAVRSAAQRKKMARMALPAPPPAAAEIIEARSQRQAAALLRWYAKQEK